MPGHSIEIKALQLAGGISKQPAHERFAGQVEDAINATFALVDGVSKRPGSILVSKLSGLSTGTNSIYRLHGINRDASEKYLVVYAINTLLAWHVNGTPCDIVGLSSNAANYFAANNATADQLRLVSIADYTIIANTTVPLGVSVTPSYTVTAEWPTYEQMVSHTPTSLAGSTTINTAGDLTYHRTNNDSSAEPAGYYLYSVSGNTFPTIQFAEIGGANGGGSPAEWADAVPRGFKIRFEKRQDSFTTATWTTATKTLTLAGNWAGYAFQAGDDAYVSGGGTGGHIVAGWYKIVSRGASGNSLVLNREITDNNSNQSNVTGGGIGQEYRVEFSGTGGTLPTMHDVAKFIQSKLQGAGAIDALVEWTDTRFDGTYYYGYFTITAPWRGSGAKVTVVTNNPSPPGGDITTDTAGDLTRDNGDLGGYPQAAFCKTGAVLVLGGGGGPRTLPIDQRWTRVAAPGDKDGTIDATKAPIQLVRQSPAGSGTITGVSVANPTTITTSAAHGLVAGQTVVIAGTNTNATTVGTFTVLDAPSPTTFRLSINVTVVTVGTGTFTSWPRFTYDLITWNNRTSGTDATNPTPIVFKNGTKIADIGFYRQRFLIAAGEHVVMSAASDLFRLYLDDANNLVDSDPIDAPLSSDRVTIINFITPVRDTVLVTTFAGQQYALGAPDNLTPSTVSFTRATTLQTLPGVRPVVLDPTLYLAAAAGGKSQIREAFFVDQSVPTDAADVSAHVSGTAIDAGLLPAGLQTLAPHANSRTVFVLPSPGANVIYLYKSFWSGPRKEQSAWSKWTFDAASRISDILVIDDYLYLLIESANQWVIEKVPMFEPSAGNYPYTLHMDRQIPFASGTGVFGAGVTTWTLPGGLSDTTLNTIVRENGSTIPVLAAAGTTVTATGNFSAVAVTIGRTYPWSVTLSEPYPTDIQARTDYQRAPEIGLKLLQQRLAIVHASSGAYNVVCNYELGNSSTFAFAPASGFTERAGRFNAWAAGDLSRASIVISSSAVTPVTICSYTHHGDFAPREYGP